MEKVELRKKFKFPHLSQDTLCSSKWLRNKGLNNFHTFKDALIETQKDEKLEKYRALS